MRAATGSRPSPAIVLAAIALVAALAGTAVAGPGAVVSAELSKKKVKKIANKAVDKRFPVGTGDIAEGAVTSGKLANDAVTSLKLGPITTRTASQSADSGQYAEATATCQSNEKLISGGARWENSANNEFTVIADSHKQGEGWYARGHNGFPSTRTLVAEAYCLAG